MTAFSAKRRRAAEVRVSAENSRFENDKFRLRGTERGDCPVPTPSAGGLNLIRAHRNDIAAAMKIPPGDFRWYAAFHDEGEHPHIHMMAWSAKAGQAYLSKEGIRQIKSKLTNDIFRNEMLHLYEQKSESRDELVRQARRAMLELVQTMRDGVCNHPDAEQLMLELAAQLETVKGKKRYAERRG